MAVTKWNPATKVGRGNITVGIVPAIANIEAPTLAEINTGIGIECSITNFNGTSSTDAETVDWLCDPASEQLPGTITHEIEDITLKATGQADEELIKALRIGDPIYIWRRDGLSHTSEPQTGQFVWVWRCIISSIDPAEANNTFVGITAHVTVSGRSRTAVKIV